MATPTKRQKEIFEFITSYIRHHGIAPTFEEIKKRFRLSALSTIHQHVGELVKKGFLVKTKNSSRGIELAKNITINIPLAGTITAGYPIEAIEEHGEEISVAYQDLPGNTSDFYALRVKGDSMVNEGIFDSDVVIIKKQSVAENGQTVVAVIDDNEATLKKIYKENGKFRLQPANQSILPLYRDQIEIRGVVYKIIRNFSDIAKSARENILRTIDLFAGIGGIRIGFEKAGFKTIFSNDSESQCQATYDLNFPDSKLIVEDIKTYRGLYHH